LSFEPSLFTVAAVFLHSSAVFPVRHCTWRRRRTPRRCRRTTPRRSPATLPHPPRHRLVFSTGILKISVVTDKREYRIYRNFIGDRNKISEEI
jgi:hypothetical protein